MICSIPFQSIADSQPLLLTLFVETCCLCMGGSTTQTSREAVMLAYHEDCLGDNSMYMYMCAYGTHPFMIITWLLHKILLSFIWNELCPQTWSFSFAHNEILFDIHLLLILTGCCSRSSTFVNVIAGNVQIFALFLRLTSRRIWY